LKENGGEINTYLFIKMLYLADRASLGKWSEPITGDQGSSMKYGPVVSNIYNLTRGEGVGEKWKEHISPTDPDTNFLSLLRDPGESELSPAEIAILKDIHSRFHEFTFKQIKDYSHALPEYDKSVIETNTSKPIPPEQILKAMKVGEERMKAAELENQEMWSMKKLFGAF
jgi:hypothetical protein